MSEGWQVGDLAVKRRGPCDVIPRGTVLRVTGIIRRNALLLEGWPDVTVYRGVRCTGFLASNFDKIKPDTEPCEEEFTVLIKRGRRVQA